MVRSGGRRQRRGAAYFLYRWDPGGAGLRVKCSGGKESSAPPSCPLVIFRELCVNEHLLLLLVFPCLPPT